MKKLILAIIVVMTVMLTGCGDKAEEGSVMYVGTNAEFKPFEYLEDGKIVGFDIDLMEAIGEEIGYEVEWVNMSFSGLIPALQSKKIDMIIAGMSATEERKKAVDFSTSYHNGKQVIVMNEKDEKKFKMLGGLKGMTVGAQLGSIQEKIAIEEGAKDVASYDSFTGAILDLKQEKIDAVILSSATVPGYIKSNPTLKPMEYIEPRSGGSAIAIPKGSSELQGKLNKAIEKLKSDGTYDKLIKKYNII